MRDLLQDYERLAAAGDPVGRAVVVSVWGSAPRGPGASLLATSNAQIAGSVSGGCIEGAAAEEISRSIETGVPRLVSFGVSDEKAWSVGLSCGGEISILVEPAVRPELVERLKRDVGVVLATVIQEGELMGAAWLVGEKGEVDGPMPAGKTGERAGATLAPAEDNDAVGILAEKALDALRAQRSRTDTIPIPGHGDVGVFLEAHPPRPKLVIFGGVHIAQELVPLARRLGYHVTVADGRSAFADPGRFPSADRLICAWPEEAFGQITLDSNTYVCVLSHDPKFDDPALEIVLKTPVRYVGVLGSSKTQARRRRRLEAAGVTAEQLGRLRGPIGLDLGSRAPADIALSILAEITAVRYGGGAAAAVR